MAGGLLDFDVHMVGVKPIEGRIGLAKELVGDLRPAWDAIHVGNSKLLPDGRSFLRIIREQYATRGARGGARWRGYDSEPVYRRIKIKFGGGEDNILRWVPERERLYPSLVIPTHEQHLFEPSRHAVRIGTTVPYAVRHQKGEGMQKYDRIALPRRPIIALTKADARAWFRVIQRHVAQAGELRGARRTV